MLTVVAVTSLLDYCTVTMCEVLVVVSEFKSHVLEKIWGSLPQVQLTKPSQVLGIV